MADRLRIHAAPFDTGIFKNDGSASFVAQDIMGFWDKNIEVQTAPKLIGAGSYILSKRVTEQDITITLVSFGSKTSNQSLHSQLMTNAAGESEASVYFYPTPGSLTNTVKSGYISSVRMSLQEDYATFVIIIKNIAG